MEDWVFPAFGSQESTASWWNAYETVCYQFTRKQGRVFENYYRLQ
jgi:hypothetical protein